MVVEKKSVESKSRRLDIIELTEENIYFQMQPISTSCIQKEYKKNIPVLNTNNNKTIQQ